ncbi:hypothetical protein HWV62_37821 [Athelia sp. TMB]|nr:hypothetical protein HWV62_37821 [Athelia sp. TMB]
MAHPPAKTQTTVDGLSVRSLESVRDVVDFRLDAASRPSAEQLDETFGQQLGDLVHGHAHHAQPGGSDPEKASDEKVDAQEPLYASSPRGSVVDGADAFVIGAIMVGGTIADIWRPHE